MASKLPAPPSRRGRRGCLACCGLFAALFLAGFLAVAAVLLLPRFIGPSPEDLVGGAPDPVASAAVSAALSDAGLHDARVTVFPILGSDEQLAYIVLDETSGFSGTGTAEGNEQAFLAVVHGLAEANQAQDLRLGLVAMEYRDETGASLFSVAVSQENVEAYAAGEISQEEFLAGTEANLTSLLAQAGDLVEGIGK